MNLFLAMASVSSTRKYIILTFISIIILNCENFGNAEQDPAGFAKALSCFSKNYIYSGCNEAYRLNQIGNINVPIPAINEFCQGPCLSEIEQVLNCLNNMFSNFQFYNKASISQIRKALHEGCSYTNQRGNFNVWDYLQGETSISSKLTVKPIEIYSVLLVAGYILFALPL